MGQDWLYWIVDCRAHNLYLFGRILSGPTGRILSEMSRRLLAAWLDQETSFNFTGPGGASCTVIKELRPHYNNPDDLRPIWYAHRRLDGKLRRRYIGKPENVTFEQLKAVAFELSQRELI